MGPRPKGKNSRLLIDMTGKQVGMLFVIEFAGHGREGRPSWLCKCECGTEKVISGKSIRTGKVRSCGCLKEKVLEARNVTHGASKTREHRIWLGMLSRCRNPKVKEYRFYGARGIKVCERWEKSFENFITDMGMPENPRASIDRIDTNGDYEPGNCKWSDFKSQARNTRRNVNITFNGKSQCVAAWAEEIGLPCSVIHTRLRSGWSDEETLTIQKLPPNGNRPHRSTFGKLPTAKEARQ